MLDKLPNAPSAGNNSFGLAGLGSSYGLQPYPDTLHRGYGWGRMMDSDFPTELVVRDFRSNAVQATCSAKEHNKIKYPRTCH